MLTFKKWLKRGEKILDIINAFNIVLNFYIFIFLCYTLNNIDFKITIKSFLIISIFSTAYYYITKLNFFNNIKLVITFIFLTVILRMTLKINFLSIIESSLMSISILIFSETIFILFARKTSLISLDNTSQFILSFLVYLLALFIAYFRNFLSKTLNFKINIDNRDKILSIFIIIITSVVLFSYLVICKNFNLLSDTMALLLLCVFSLLYLIITLAFMCINYVSQKNIDNLKESEEKYKQLKLYSDITESLVEDVSKFRHDYKNIIFMMNGYIENNDYTGLVQYFNEKLLPERDFDEIPKLKKIKNSGLKGLLAAKISLMQKQKIEFSLDILNNINDLCIDTLDLCRIIGILLDNAIEASLETPEKFISICFLSDDLGIYITILNSFNGSVNLREIYKKGYSTKGYNRGIGLSNAQDIILEKYDNILLNTTIEKNLFIQDIYIAK